MKVKLALPVPNEAMRSLLSRFSGLAMLAVLAWIGLAFCYLCVAVARFGGGSMVDMWAI